VLCAGLYGEPERIVVSVRCSCTCSPPQDRKSAGWLWCVVHAEDGCTASDVEDDLVLEDVAVVVDRVAVTLSADLVFLSFCKYSRDLVIDSEWTNKHFLVDACWIVSQIIA